MAGEPGDLGRTVGNLQAALDATKGKARGAIKDLEKAADEREKALKDADIAEEEAVQKTEARSGRQRTARKANADAVERQSAAIDQSEATVRAETEIVNQNTAAIERNVAARRRAVSTPAISASERLAAAEAEAARRPISVPAIKGPRYVTLGERDASRQRALYEAATGRPEGVPIYGPLRPGLGAGGQYAYGSPETRAARELEQKHGAQRPYERERQLVQPYVEHEGKRYGPETAPAYLKNLRETQVAEAKADQLQISALKKEARAEEKAAAAEERAAAKTARANAKANAAAAKRAKPVEVRAAEESANLGQGPLGTTRGDLAPAVVATKASAPYRAKAEAARQAATEEEQAAERVARIEDAQLARQARLAAVEQERAANRARQLGLFPVERKVGETPGPVRPTFGGYPPLVPDTSGRLTPEQFYLQRSPDRNVGTLEQQLRNQLAQRDIFSLGAAGAAGGFGGGGRRPPVAAAGGFGGGGDDNGVRKFAAAEKLSADMAGAEAAARAKSNAILEKSIATYAQSSQQLQRHGALTAEFISSLARGEVTLREFESQLTITIGKFAGWAVAGGLVYGAYEGIKKLLGGVVDTQTGVEQLKRSLGEKVNVPAAEEGFRKLSAEVNVPIGGTEDSASTAQFYSARVFNDQTRSLQLASTALKAYKLDQVSVQDAVKSLGAVSVAFGLGPKELGQVFDQLDVGQLKFNARLNQTLPQVGRAAASFAAAGGTAKELVDQVIEINRATGGGGGTGGGNPATALLREPANLTRPESEQTLLRYNIDPKWARSHIGQFNQLIQEKAKEGKLDENDLQALAKAAGAGAGVGFRYLLPLFRQGRTGLPERVREETSKAAGSAEDDLKHKLAQFDEQLKKVGVDFELFGSKLGGTGIEQTLGDIVGALGLVVKAGGAVVQPFAKLGSALSEIPSPLRQVLEAAAAYRGAQLIGRSQVGLAGRRLASESGLLTYAGGGSAELLAVQAAQRKYGQFLQNRLESQAGAQLLAAEKFKAADTALLEFRRAGPADASEESQAAFGAKEKSLEARRTAALEAQTAADEDFATLKAAAIERQAVLATLEDRHIAAEERLVFASEKGLYAAELGSPNIAPILAPTQQAAKAEAAQAQRAATRQGVTGAAAAASTATAPLADSVTGVETAAVATATGSSLLGSRLERTNAALRGVPGRLGNVASGLRGFVGNLGIIGKGIALFAGAEILSNLLGAQHAFQQEAATLNQFKAPTSELDVKQAIKKVHQPGLLEGIGKAFGELGNIATHPLDALETLPSRVGLGGPEYPGLFYYAKGKQLQKQKAEAEKKLREGRYKGLGEGEGGNALYQAEIQSNAESAAEALEKASSEEDVQKALKNEKQLTKVRLEEFKAFGAGTSFGSEELETLTAQLRALSTKFATTGNTAVFEAMVQLSEEVTQSVISAVQSKVQLLDKYGTNAESDEGFAFAQSHLAQLRQTAYHQPVEEAKKDLFNAEFNVGYNQKKLKGTTDEKLRGSLKDDIKVGKEQVEALKSNIKRLGLSAEEGEKIIKAAEAQLGLEHFTSRLEQPGGIRKKGALQQARDGANRLAKASDALRQLAQEEAAAQKAFENGILKSREHQQIAEELNQKRVEAAEALVGAHAQRIQSDTELKVSEISPKDKVGRADKELGGAERQLKYYQQTKNLTPQARAEYEREAKIRVNNARFAAQEAREAEEKESAGRAKERERIQALGDREESLTRDPIKQARVKLRTDEKLIPGAKGNERISLEADRNRAKQGVEDASFSEAESDIKFHLQMHEISKQAAISQLQGLLKLKNLTKQARQQLLLEIRQLQQPGNNEGAFSLKPGDIKLPGVYDARRVIGEARYQALHQDDGPRVIGQRAQPGGRGPRVIGQRAQPTSLSPAVTGGVSAQISNVNYITVLVRHQGDAARVGDEIERVTGANLRGRQKAAGVR